MAAVLLGNCYEMVAAYPGVIICAGHSGIFHIIPEKLLICAVVGQVMVAECLVYFGNSVSAYYFV